MFVTVRNLRTNNATDVLSKVILWQNKALEKNTKSILIARASAEFGENPQRRQQLEKLSGQKDSGLRGWNTFELSDSSSCSTASETTGA